MDIVPAPPHFDTVYDIRTNNGAIKACSINSFLHIVNVADICKVGAKKHLLSSDFLL